MNLKTFYKIYYKHRFKKASLFLKVYLFFSIFIKYILNLFYIQKTINVDNLGLKNKFLYEKNLNFLFEYFNSDKGELYINQYAQPIKRRNKKIIAHGYAKTYESFFKSLKYENLKILEIGSFYGNASAALSFYFKNSLIYSADINPDMYKYKGLRLKNFFVDSSSRDSINKHILQKNFEFNIIIEDASHMLKDQIISLFMLFPKIKEGGIFVVEEIDFPEKREDMRIGQVKPDLKTILKRVQSKENFDSNYITNKEKDYFLKNVDSIEFFTGNINEIAIIKKKNIISE